MTRSPTNSQHIFRSVTEKATNSDPAYRYADAEQLSAHFEKSVSYHQKKENEQSVLARMAQGIFDEYVENYIYELNSEKISRCILDDSMGMHNGFLQFMKCDESHAQFIIKSIDNTYQDVCGRAFKAYDPFASFTYRILKEEFPFTVKETAANILRYIATDVNRYEAQNLVEKLKKQGIEPMLEDILNS